MRADRIYTVYRMMWWGERTREPNIPAKPADCGRTRKSHFVIRKYRPENPLDNLPAGNADWPDRRIAMFLATTTDARKFRMAILPMWFFILVLGYLFGFVGNLIVFGRSLDLHTQPAIFGVSAVLAGISTVVLRVFFPTSLTVDGVYAHSVWGKPCFAAWRDITRVQPFRILNLQWLRLYTSRGEVTWLAMFQSHREQFLNELGKLAPANSPMRKFLP